MEVLFDSSFEKSIDNINDSKIKENLVRFIEDVENCKALSELTGIKKLEGFKTYFRKRIGDYRVGFELQGNSVTFIVIAHRKKIYRIFP